MLARERLHDATWVPPWLRFQHVARYEWARQYCRDAVVLDAACGNGYGSGILREVSTVSSLDIAPDAIDEARGKSPALRLLLGDTTRLPFRSGTFGAFASFETIEHVADDGAYVAEARRVIRRGGVFLCSTPNRLLVNPGNTINDRPFNPFHVREYSAAELKGVLARGFDEVTMLGQSRFGRAYAGMLRTVGRRWRNGGVRLHQMRKLALMPFERRERHEPRPFGPGEEPEVLIAVCR
jgi:SAM-dependent methyltransferase